MNIGTIKFNCYIEGVRVPLISTSMSVARNSLSKASVTIPLANKIDTKAFASAFVQITYLTTKDGHLKEHLFYEGICTECVLQEEINKITLSLDSKFSVFNFNSTLDYVSPKKYGLQKLDEGLRIWVGSESYTSISNSDFQTGTHLSDRYFFMVDEDILEIDPADTESNKLFWVLNRFPYAERIGYVFFEDISYNNFFLTRSYIDRFNLLAKSTEARKLIAEKQADITLIRTIGTEIRSDLKRSGIEYIMNDRKQVSRYGCTAPEDTPTDMPAAFTGNVVLTKDAINFQDFIKNDPRRQYVAGRGMSPYGEQWCTKETANALLEAGKLIYQKYNTPLVVGDLSSLSGGQMVTFGPHKEHKEGHVVDLYVDGATNIYAGNYSVDRTIGCINILGSVGAVSVGFLDPKNNDRITREVNIKHRRLSGHENHYHVRFFY